MITNSLFIYNSKNYVCTSCERKIVLPVPKSKAETVKLSNLFSWLDLLWLDVIVVQLHKYLAPLCIRRRFDQFLSKRKLGPILYVRSRPGLSTIPAGPTELEAHCWHMPFPLIFSYKVQILWEGHKIRKNINLFLKLCAW